MDLFLSEKVRAWGYRVIAGLVPLAVSLGYLGPEIGEHVLVVALAVLGLSSAGLASLNTSTKDEFDDEDDLLEDDDDEDVVFDDQTEG